MKIFLDDDLIIVKDQEAGDEISLEVLIQGITAAMEGVIGCPILGRLAQRIYLISLSNPIRSQTELIHVVEVVEIVWLCHVAVLIHQEAGRIHFADIDFARVLSERSQA